MGHIFSVQIFVRIFAPYAGSGDHSRVSELGDVDPCRGGRICDYFGGSPKKKERKKQFFGSFPSCLPKKQSKEDQGPVKLSEDGGHLKPVTLKPVIRIFPRFRVRIFRVFRFALRNLLRPLFFWGETRRERDFPHFPFFPRIADFENPTKFPLETTV